MNLRDLEYLLAIAEHKNFGKAAKQCFVSQPALSIQIKKLETYLGIRLIDRKSKTLQLTESGLAIVNKAKQILNLSKEIQELAKVHQNPFAGELRLGIFPTLAPYLLPLLFPALSKAFPNIQFHLIEEQTNDLLASLQNGKLHGAILAGPIENKSLTSHLLFEEEFLLALPKAHQLAKRVAISQSDLAEHPLLLLNEGHCLRDQALAVCQHNKSQELQNFQATSLETLRHMVIAGLGMSLLPALAQNKNDKLAYISFKKPKPSRTIGLFWVTENFKTAVLIAMSEKIKEVLQKEKRVKVL